MDNTDYPFEVDEWLKQAGDKKRTGKEFIGSRPYRHFDGKVTHDDLYSNSSRLVPVLKDPNLLAKHSFLPFIRKDKKVRRFTRSSIDQKLRPIMYASHRDACIYSFYSYLLKQAYENRIRDTELAKSVIAYRHIPREDNENRGKSNIDFAKEIYELATKYPKCAVLCLDISKFFDTMDHRLIKDRWQNILGFDNLSHGHSAVYKNITKYRYVFLYDALTRLGYGRRGAKGRFIYFKKNKHKTGSLCLPIEYRQKIDSKKNSLIHKHRSNKGIPQGSPISDVIANIYLEDFDRSIIDKLQEYGFGHYRRYSDDILIICPEDKVKDIYNLALDNIKGERLVIKPEKSVIVILDNKNMQVKDITYRITGVTEHELYAREAFQYLGFEIDTKDLHIRSGTIAAHYRRAKRRSEAFSKEKVNIKRLVKKMNTDHRRHSHFQYFINAKNMTGSQRINTQYKKVRKRVKTFS